MSWSEMPTVQPPEYRTTAEVWDYVVFLLVVIGIGFTAAQACTTPASYGVDASVDAGADASDSR